MAAIVELHRGRHRQSVHQPFQGTAIGLDAADLALAELRKIEHLVGSD